MNDALQRFIDLNCPGIPSNSEKVTFLLLEEITKLKNQNREA